jgi:hypothetical protein
MVAMTFQANFKAEVAQELFDSPHAPLLRALHVEGFLPFDL